MDNQKIARLQNYILIGENNLTPSEFNDYQRLYGEYSQDYYAKQNKQELPKKRTFWDFCDAHPYMMGILLCLVLPFLFITTVNGYLRAHYGDPAIRAKEMVQQQYSHYLQNNNSGRNN